MGEKAISFYRKADYVLSCFLYTTHSVLEDNLKEDINIYVFPFSWIGQHEKVKNRKALK